MSETGSNRERKRRDLHVRGMGDCVLEALDIASERRLWWHLRQWPRTVDYRGCIDEFISATLVEPTLTTAQVSALPVAARRRLRLAALEVIGASRGYRRLGGSPLSADERAFAALYWRRERQVASHRNLVARLRAHRANSITVTPKLSQMAQLAGQRMLDANHKGLLGLFDEKRGALAGLSLVYEPAFAKALRSTSGLAGLGVSRSILGPQGGRAARHLAGLAGPQPRSLSIVGRSELERIRHIAGLGIDSVELRQAVRGLSGLPSHSSLLALNGLAGGVSASMLDPTVAARLRASPAYAALGRVDTRALLGSRGAALTGFGAERIRGAIRPLAFGDPHLRAFGLGDISAGIARVEPFAGTHVGDADLAESDRSSDEDGFDEAFDLIVWFTLVRVRSVALARDAQAAGSRALDIGNQWLWGYPLSRLADYREVAPYLTTPQRKVLQGGFIGAAILIAQAVDDSLGGITFSSVLSWLEAAAALQATYWTMDAWSDKTGGR